VTIVFIEERHQNILELIKEIGRVEVTELSKIFKLSEDSIRRDLRLMEEKGLVKRTYGGAILPDKCNQSARYKERKELNTEVKSLLANLAVTFIQDNDTIWLDGSSTISMMVPLLNKAGGLTVITNSISIANDIMNLTDAKLFMVGGMVDRESTNAAGIESIKILQQLTVDKVFISPCGISPEWGLSDNSLDEAEIKRTIIDAGREVYILADSSKFGQRSLARISLLQPDFTIITDQDISQDMRQQLQGLIQKGLRLITGDGSGGVNHGH
jgi:DeoR/GlpR family transcriptional regulator of sugar metabolism